MDVLNDDVLEVIFKLLPGKYAVSFALCCKRLYLISDKKSTIRKPTSLLHDEELTPYTIRLNVCKYKHYCGSGGLFEYNYRHQIKCLGCSRIMKYCKKCDIKWVAFNDVNAATVGWLYDKPVTHILKARYDDYNQLITNYPTYKSGYDPDCNKFVIYLPLTILKYVGVGDRYQYKLKYDVQMTEAIKQRNHRDEIDAYILAPFIQHTIQLSKIEFGSTVDFTIGSQSIDFKRIYYSYSRSIGTNITKFITHTLGDTNMLPYVSNNAKLNIVAKPKPFILNHKNIYHINKAKYYRSNEKHMNMKHKYTQHKHNW
jgi:hypothetical protein